VRVCVCVRGRMLGCVRFNLYVGLCSASCRHSDRLVVSHSQAPLFREM
jgi:hypothetical protein